MRGWRSLLFMPAHQERLVAKAHAHGADAVVLDLEDAVPQASKSAARSSVRDSIGRLRAFGQDTVVRINQPWRLAVEDIAAAVRPDLDALMVPKVEDVARLAVLSDIIGEWEAERRLPVGAVGVIALIETPRALPVLAEIADHPRTIALAFGPEDFSAELGVAPSAASLDLPCRMIALAAAPRRLMALGVPASIADYETLDAYSAAAELAKRFGMTGGLAIHPRQVRVLNETFRPSPEEVLEAGRILEAWSRCGSSGVASLEGRMIDRPVIARARRALNWASPGGMRAARFTE